MSRNVIENPEVVHYQLVIARLEGKLAQYQEQQARLEALLSGVCFQFFHLRYQLTK